MKHINEPPPDLVERRPDAPLRLVAAIERALEKDPARRFQTMNDLAHELRLCLRELDEPDAERTFVKQSPVLRESRPHRARARRSRVRLYAVLVLLAAAAIIVGVLALGGSKGSGKQQSGGGATGGAKVTLRGVSGYDPGGTGGEHDSSAGQATDGNPSTFWYTEHYASSSFGGLKDGVGLVVDAGRSQKLASVTVTSDTPGFSAQILSGNAAGGPFVQDSSVRPAGATTTFPLRGATGRYYVVWITNLGTSSSVHVNEVVARS
jgi:hypothetical protein